nr:tetratricopeptide repeat protein [Ardenticatenales bacterium]
SGGAATPPAAPPQADEGEWSLLDELDSDGLTTGASTWEQASPSTDTRMPETGGALDDDLWSFLEEGGAPPAQPSRSGGSSSGGASAYPAATSEAELWQQSETFIGPMAGGGAAATAASMGRGDIPADSDPMVSEGEDEMGGVPERGAFSFMDVPPSAAATIPVRNSFAPLAAEQILEVVGAPPQSAKKEDKKGKEDKKEKKEKESSPRSEGGSRAMGCLRSVLVTGVVLALLAALVLFAPTSVTSNLPAPAATGVAEAQIYASAFFPPDPIPLPDWVEQAQTARYGNDRTQAETLLREGLSREPQNVSGLVTLSALKLEQPGGDQEALTLAQQALDAATNVEDRTLAAEAFVWAMDRQPAPDVGNAMARADQAVFDTPRNPHAYWARAIATAMNGEVDFATKAASLATALAHTSEKAENVAKNARFYARIGESESAALYYQAALEEYDYVPWRVELVRLLRTLERGDEAQIHLDHLREIAPDDPAVQGLGQ